MLESPLFTGSLPPSTLGPDQSIGYAYIRTGPRVAGHTVPWPKDAGSRESVLRVEQVGYALFYPCSDKRAGGAGVPWLPEPIADTVQGYQRFLGRRGLSVLFKGLGYIAGRLRFPAQLNAPLLDPLDPLDPAVDAQHQHPLAIFSHGLAGTRHTYTHYCSSLASQGYVVVAVEHRDGSAPSVTLPSGPDGQQRVLPYIRKDDIVWDEEMDTTGTGSLDGFRTAQLELRVREVYEAFWSFKALVDGTAVEGVESGMEAGQWAGWIASFKDRVDFGKVDLTGHSFGGGTMLHLVNKPSSPEPALERLPVNKIIALDPWLEPIPVPTASCPAPDQPTPPTLIINSPGFTVWDDHFDRLVDLSKTADATLVTLLGSNHQSFSDFSFLSPWSPRVAIGYLATVAQLSCSFLEGTLLESPLIKGKTPDEGKYAKDAKGRMEGKDGDIVVHRIGGL